jgi:hypothetical protein
MSYTTLILPERFRGPPASANGGYTCGVLAGFVSGPAEVTLRAPPPLNVPLELVDETAGGISLQHDGTLIAEARPTHVELTLPHAPSFEQATEASAHYLGFKHHLYPSCFVCGPLRDPGDGLRIFPGRLEHPRVAAAPWVPPRDLCDGDGLVEARFVWAALDCPSWWGYAAFNEPGPPILLGRLAAEIRARPRAEERCVVIGFGLGREGRRISCGSALVDGSGQYIAWARATWIELKR